MTTAEDGAAGDSLLVMMAEDASAEDSTGPAEEGSRDAVLLGEIEAIKVEVGFGVSEDVDGMNEEDSGDENGVEEEEDGAEESGSGRGLDEAEEGFGVEEEKDREAELRSAPHSIGFIQCGKRIHSSSHQGGVVNMERRERLVGIVLTLQRVQLSSLRVSNVDPSRSTFK